MLNIQHFFDNFFRKLFKWIIKLQELNQLREWMSHTFVEVKNKFKIEIEPIE